MGLVDRWAGSLAHTVINIDNSPDISPLHAPPIAHPKSHTLYQYCRGNSTLCPRLPKSGYWICKIAPQCPLFSLFPLSKTTFFRNWFRGHGGCLVLGPMGSKSSLLSEQLSTNSPSHPKSDIAVIQNVLRTYTNPKNDD